MRTAFKLFGALLLLPLGYVVAVLARGTYSDWKPIGVTSINVDGGAASAKPITDSVLSFVTWNVGYGGLGAEADFFLDGGAFLFSRGLHVRMPAADVERYSDGIAAELTALKADFYLLQEVDSLSDRSYGRNQSAQLRATKSDYASSFAANYINERVPIPVFEPWNVYGAVHSGLQNQSRFSPSAAHRHTLPGEFPWPDKLFQLDRCLLVQRHPLADGRELVVVNLHLSAYDADGSVKASQLEYLKDYLLAERDAGHLVVVGGDWNLMPPNFDYEHFVGEPEGRYQKSNLPNGFPAEDWTLVYDLQTPTNRKIDAPYHSDSSFVTTIDYFLLSPGLRARRAHVIDQDFAFSDHQPVFVEVVIESDLSPANQNRAAHPHQGASLLDGECVVAAHPHAEGIPLRTSVVVGRADLIVERLKLIELRTDHRRVI